MCFRFRGGKLPLVCQGSNKGGVLKTETQNSDF